ncbi:protein O-mannose beta-1,4-N-acetylglucosaminyltransferase [Pelomyxa schiedti]|nr:protein O-mannose beta-1,4-N-acetylglucosaminyltransferase [Pelomyxa schiedti]
MWVHKCLFVVVSCLAALASTSYSSGSCEIIPGRNDEPKSHRTCLFHDVCVRGDEWFYYLDDGSDTSYRSNSLGDPSLVHTGTYTSSTLFSLKTVHGPIPSDAVFVDTPSVVIHTVSEMYFHFLLDDFFGVWWLMWYHNQKSPGLFFNRDGSPRNDVQFLSVARASSHSHMFNDVFSNIPIKKPGDYKQLTCFHDLAVGPSAHQLGGPGSNKVTKQDLLTFKEFLFNRFALRGCEKDPSHITLVQREKSPRYILNIDEFAAALSAENPTYKVDIVILEKMSFPDQLKQFCQSAGFVAMHGSAMANIVFLPQTAQILELFPYGFERPTFKGISYKMNMKYTEWKNSDRSRTVFHPNILNEFTSDQATKNQIMEAPAYNVKMPWAGNMYWINQDTNVDPKAAKLMHLQKRTPRKEL